VLSEALMRLTTLPALQVVPASETRRLAIQTPERAKMEFGSNLAVQGDFKWRGAKILVQCTLIDTATQNQLRDRRITANVDELDKLPDMVFKA
jgi:hypothetical protein